MSHPHPLPPPAPGHEVHNPSQDPTADFDRDIELAAMGDAAARQRLWQDHFENLRRLVVAWFERCGGTNRRRGDLSIGPTHIVGELYLKLSARDGVFGQGRERLFRCFYTECSRIYLDHLRKRRRHHQQRVDLPDDMAGRDPGAERLDRLDTVLAELAQHDRLDADIAAMKVLESIEDERHPGGMRKITNAEVAARLGCSLRLVEKRWSYLKSLLSAKLTSI
jgi:DNA-directed RNA polymerase specialized sigma24 family protein